MRRVHIAPPSRAHLHHHQCRQRQRREAGHQQRGAHAGPSAMRVTITNGWAKIDTHRAEPARRRGPGPIGRQTRAITCPRSRRPGRAASPRQATRRPRRGAPATTRCHQRRVPSCHGPYRVRFDGPTYRRRAIAHATSGSTCIAWSPAKWGTRKSPWDRLQPCDGQSRPAVRRAHRVAAEDRAVANTRQLFARGHTHQPTDGRAGNRDRQAQARRSKHRVCLWHPEQRACHRRGQHHRGHIAAPMRLTMAASSGVVALKWL